MKSPPLWEIHCSWKWQSEKIYHMNNKCINCISNDYSMITFSNKLKKCVGGSLVPCIHVVYNLNFLCSHVRAEEAVVRLLPSVTPDVYFKIWCFRQNLMTPRALPRVLEREEHLWGQYGSLCLRLFPTSRDIAGCRAHLGSFMSQTHSGLQKACILWRGTWLRLYYALWKCSFLSSLLAWVHVTDMRSEWRQCWLWGVAEERHCGWCLALTLIALPGGGAAHVHKSSSLVTRWATHVSILQENKHICWPALRGACHTQDTVYNVWLPSHSLNSYHDNRIAFK